MKGLEGNNLDGIDWLRNNYKHVLKVMRQEYSDYPEVCDRVTPMLAVYMYYKLGHKDVIVSVGNYNERYHQWLVVNGEIVDILHFQFTTSDKDYNNRKFNEDFEIVQKDRSCYVPVAQKSPLHAVYTWYRYILDESSDFDDYMKKVIKHWKEGQKVTDNELKKLVKERALEYKMRHRKCLVE